MNKDMEVDLIYYELKLQSLLEKFLETGYHIKNEVYFNRLLSFLGGKENKELAEVLLKLPIMAEWISRAVKLWEDSCQTPDHSISSFSLQLLSLISRDEGVFTNLLNQNIYNRMIHVLQVQNIDSSPTIKLGFIKLLTGIITHSSGREWLFQTSYWNDILMISLQNQTVYITKEGHNFISLLIYSMLQHNVQFCEKIWKIILNPLLIKPNQRFKNQNNLFEVCDEDLERFIGPTVHLVNDILEFLYNKSLDANELHLKKFEQIMLKTELNEAILNYVHIVRNHNLTYGISCIWILLLFVSVALKSENGSVKPDIEKELIEPIYSILSIMIDNQKTSSVAKSLWFVMTHWYKLKSNVEVEYLIESNPKLTFEDQFTIPQLIPTCIFCLTVCNKVSEEDELRDDFITVLLQKYCKASIRWGFKWRDSLQPAVLLDTGPKMVAYILQLKPLISRDAGVLIFRAFLYCLVDMMSLIEKNARYIPVFVRFETFLKAILDALTEIIYYFNISWRDSIESLCVIQASVEFLKINQWPSKLVIADLNLIKTGIKKYLSPDLALLIDRKDCSGIAMLGSLLCSKLHDPEWSVRDSALEVVSALAEASYIEFQSFQKIILNNDLCNLVLTISLLDGESFVRASALKCLNQLVQIDVFWKNHLESKDIPKRIISLLKHETEGIVRAEAVSLISTIFKYRLLQPTLNEEIYSCMTMTGLNDLHWEVRYNTLTFWKDRMDQKLKDQGMVDGEFPECTFSPESKKIINLTDSEIKTRLLRVLDQLSETGCLTVLKHAISEDCDIQVSKKGLEISKRLVDLIEKYKVADNVNFEETGPPSNDSCYSSNAASTPSSFTQTSDDIIDQILGVSDTSLLKDVYNPEKDYRTDGLYVSKWRKVSTSEFLSLTRKNFKSLVDEREKWINSLDSLSSLLNDMLGSYDTNDTNAMDCY